MCKKSDERIGVSKKTTELLEKNKSMWAGE